MPRGIRSQPQGVIAITKVGLVPVRCATERTTAKFVLSDPSERAEKLTLSLQRYYFYVLFGEREIKYRVALSALAAEK
jgi:hypothetical protein